MADRVTGIQVDFGLNSQGAPSSLFQAAQQSELPRSPPPLYETINGDSIC